MGQNQKLNFLRSWNPKCVTKVRRETIVWSCKRTPRIQRTVLESHFKGNKSTE
jgi:hypothetical protein